MGSPAFKWGSSSSLVLVEPLKFREGGYSHAKTRFRSVAIDQRTVRVETFGGGAEEIACHIRFVGDASNLLDMLVTAVDGEVLDYYPDGTLSLFYPVLVMSFDEMVSIVPDRDRFGFGEWEVPVILRRVDGGSLAGLVEL